jgi:NAD(P)-dependent dehydrogenase (short-subunit alcohol dehydrogenase family)
MPLYKSKNWATACAVSKSAGWSLTNGLRNELRQHGTQVLDLHVGFADTDLTRGLDVVKVSPQSVVIAAFEAWRPTRARCSPTSAPGRSNAV